MSDVRLEAISGSIPIRIFADLFLADVVGTYMEHREGSEHFVLQEFNLTPLHKENPNPTCLSVNTNRGKRLLMTTEENLIRCGPQNEKAPPPQPCGTHLEPSTRVTFVLPHD